MFRVLLCFLIAAASLGIANAQEWARSFGNVDFDQMRDMVSDSKGNIYILAGYEGEIDLGNGITISPDLERNSFVAKYNSSGECQWVQNISSVKFIELKSIELDSTGNIYVGGKYQDSTSFGNGIYLSSAANPDYSWDCFISKFDTDGKCLWAKGLGSYGSANYMRGIATDADGNAYILADYFKELTIDNEIKMSSEVKHAENYIAKFAPDGKCQWVTGFHQSNVRGKAQAIASDANGNLVIIGEFTDTLSFGNDVSITASEFGDGYIAAFNSNGVCQWAKAFRGTATNNQMSVDLDAKSNMYLMGWYSDTLSLGNGITLTTTETRKCYFAKLTPSGECVWAKNIGGTRVYPDVKYVDAIGNTYISGTFYGTTNLGDNNGQFVTSANDGSVFLIKYDTLGNYVSGNIIADCHSKYFNLLGLTVDDDDKAYISGDFSGFFSLASNQALHSNGSLDCFLMKVNSQTRYYPTLKYPILNAHTMSINTNLEWNSVLTATAYRLQLSKSADFSSLVLDEKIDKATTTRTLNDLQYNTKYYWRVQTVVNNDTSLWSPTWNFHTGYDPNAQVWAQTIGSDNSSISPFNIAIDSSNNYYLLGDYSGEVYLGDGKYVNSNDDEKGYISKYNSLTLPEWFASQSSTKYDRYKSFIYPLHANTDSDGNIYVNGRFIDTVMIGNTIKLISENGAKSYLAKYNNSGECLWAKAIGDTTYNLNYQFVRKDYIYVVGSYRDSISLGNGIKLRWLLGPASYIAKYNFDGECVWANTLFSGGNANGVTVDSEGNIIVVGNCINNMYFLDGFVISPSGLSNGFIAKYDSLGSLIESKNFIGNNSVLEVVSDNNGNIYTLGSFLNQIKLNSDFVLSSHDVYDAYIAKYNSVGEIIWAKQVYAQGENHLSTLKLDNNGDVYLAGGFSVAIRCGNSTELTSAGGHDYFVIKMNQDGKSIWARSFGTSSKHEYLNNIVFDTDNRMFILGGLFGAQDIGNGFVVNNGSSVSRTLIKYQSFFVNPPALQIPDYDMRNVNTNSSLVWSAIKNANQYRVQLSTTQDFAALAVNKLTNNTSADFTSLLDSTKYYWRVKGITDTDSTDWSVTWSFTTGATADVPESNNEIISISPLPVRDEAIITYNIENVNAGISIVLYDLKGTIVATYNFTSIIEGTNELRLDVSNIPSGMYNAVIKNGAAVHNAKLIKVD